MPGSHQAIATLIPRTCRYQNFWKSAWRETSIDCLSASETSQLHQLVDVECAFLGHESLINLGGHVRGDIVKFLWHAGGESVRVDTLYGMKKQARAVWVSMMCCYCTLSCVCDQRKVPDLAQQA